jgi:periplasmic copper chaperone A
MRSPKNLLILAAALTLVVAPFAQAKDRDAVHVKDAWIRVMPGTLPNAGYAVLQNDSDRTVKLVSADSPAYGHVMLHESREVDGVSHMHMIKNLPIPAHGMVKLAPGGYHLMLMQRAIPVKPGTKVEVTLKFADGSTLRQAFLARPANASGISD